MDQSDAILLPHMRRTHRTSALRERRRLRRHASARLDRDCVAGHVANPQVGGTEPDVVDASRRDTLGHRAYRSLRRHRLADGVETLSELRKVGAASRRRVLRRESDTQARRVRGEG